MTKYRDVVRMLEGHGFVNKGGAKHDTFVHRDGRIARVPRHREIDDSLVRLIRKQAGIDR